MPYANGYAHIGHLRTYIPGDVYVRFLKRFGFDVIFICGSDVNGAPIEMAAHQAGISPQELIKKYHAHYKKIFEQMCIGVDFYGSTAEPYHYKRVQNIIKTLEERGFIEARVVELPYCPKDQMFLADRFLIGTCPYCGAEARGDECDQGCQRYLDADQLINPRCAICGSPAEKKRVRHYFFKLPEFTDFLIEFNEKLHGTPIARNYALGWIRQGLKDWCITRNLKWGIPYPSDKSLVLYVWADNYAGYISFTEEWAKQTGNDWKDYWKGKGKIIHFIGADIVYHHAVFWPAILKGAGYSTPWGIVASGMVKIEGHPLSKSRGFVAEIEEDFIQQGFDLDTLRYYMITYTGQTRDLDFVWKDFQTKVNNELVGILGNFAYRTLLFNFNNFKQVPEGTLLDETRERIQNAIKTTKKAIKEYKFKEAADAVMHLATYGNVSFQQSEPWKLIKEKPKLCQTSLFNSLQLLKAIAILIEPIMPSKAEILWQQLGLTGDVHKTNIKECLELLKTGTPLPKPEILFNKILDEKIEEMTEILNKRIEAALAKKDS